MEAPTSQALSEAPILLVKQALLTTVMQEGFISPQSEAQVQKALHLLRVTGSDPELLTKVETISCAVAGMRPLLQSGRVNAYSSQLLRLMKAVQAL